MFPSLLSSLGSNRRRLCLQLPPGALLASSLAQAVPQRTAPPGSFSPQPLPGQPGVAISRPPIAASYVQVSVPARPPGPPPGQFCGTGLRPQPHVPTHRPDLPSGTDVSRIPTTPVTYIPVVQQPTQPGALEARSRSPPARQPAASSSQAASAAPARPPPAEQVPPTHMAGPSRRPREVSPPPGDLRGLPKQKTVLRPAPTRPDEAFVGKCLHCERWSTAGSVVCNSCHRPLEFSHLLQPNEAELQAIREASDAALAEVERLRPQRVEYNLKTTRTSGFRQRSLSARSTQAFRKRLAHFVRWCRHPLFRQERAQRGQTALDPRPGSHTWNPLPDYATAPEPPLNPGFPPYQLFNPEEWMDVFQRLRDEGVDVEPIRQKWRP